MYSTKFCRYYVHNFYIYGNGLGKPQNIVLLLMTGPLRGGGGVGLNGPAIKRRTFFAGPLRKLKFF